MVANILRRFQSLLTIKFWIKCFLWLIEKIVLEKNQFFNQKDWKSLLTIKLAMLLLLLSVLLSHWCPPVPGRCFYSQTMQGHPSKPRKKMSWWDIFQHNKSYHAARNFLPKMTRFQLIIDILVICRVSKGIFNWQ